MYAPELKANSDEARDVAYHFHGYTDAKAHEEAGPLIIEDPGGHMPSYIEGVAEKTFMIMTDGIVLVDSGGGGTVNPKVVLQPGTVERWRIINANAFSNSFVHLAVDNPSIELWQIAFDGLTLPKRVKVDPDNNQEPWLNPAALAPGNRTDFMVRVPKDAAGMRAMFAAKSAPSDFLHHHQPSRSLRERLSM